MELTYKITFSMKASKDYQELVCQGYKDKVDLLLSELSVDPASPPSKRLKGRYSNLYSRILNSVDRIVHSLEHCAEGYDGVVNILRMCTDYQGILPAFLFRSRIPESR